MLTDLEWLPAPDSFFRTKLSALRAQANRPLDVEFAEKLARLAALALGEAHLTQMASLAGRLVGLSVTLAGFAKLKLGLVGDGSLSFVAAPIVGSALRHGLLLQIVEGGYDNAMQEAMDPAATLHTAGLDCLLIAPDARSMGLYRAAASAAEAQEKVASALQRLRAIAQGLRPSVAAAIFVQTVAPPLEPLFGSFDRIECGSPFAMVSALNREIAAWASAGDVILVDIARLAASIGLENWHDARHWHGSKIPFAPRCIPIYAETVARTISAARGHSKKCLVLDLDNTLWGGVIGDDGLAGIALGQGSASGEAFIAIQRIALELRARGVILAVSSKNEDAAARLPFREHPDMLLREDDIAVFQANWTDKAANLKAIAQTLSIGVEALVLLDDNAAERMQVREALPGVGVPELPADPAQFPRVLAAAGYFEAVSVSDEDRARAGYYRANAQRAAALIETTDLGVYLESLRMLCAIGPVDPVSTPRVAQLINKSNQFNLTTRRYTEAEVAAMATDPSLHLAQVRLADRFGDNGVISVIICDRKPGVWEIDTWLMSCRVLGRRVQEAVLVHLAAAARADGADTLIGRYIASPKNQLVEDHYEALGFIRMDTELDGETVWRLDLTAFTRPDLPMRVTDCALPSPADQPA